VRAAGERLDVQRLRVLAVDPVADATQPSEVAQVLRRGCAGHLRDRATRPRVSTFACMTTRPPDERGDPGPPGDAVGSQQNLLGRLEGAVVRSQHEAVSQVEARLGPAWRRATEGEPRWQVTLGLVAALLLEASLPQDVVVRPRWVLPSIGALLLVALVAATPRRIDRPSTWLRVCSMFLIAVISAANVLSAARLVTHLLRGTETGDATRLLLTGGAIWITNILAFALWYWELDRGGPVARMQAVRVYPDFLFAQMENPELAPDDWEPRFVDYLYLSFTNAAAFSPTDVLPLSPWAKLTMLLQSAVSLVTIALVVARAVNTLR
jgi:uncharacterized membrane protein